MQTPHGFTFIELLIALAIVVLGAGVIIAFVRPMDTLEVYQDRLRSEHVRNYTEALLEMKQRQPEDFAIIFEAASESKVILGENDCSGDFGKYCTDADVANDCLSLAYFEPFLNDTFIKKTSGYLDLQTGYYIEVKENVMRIGSCEAVEPARVDVTISL